MDEGEAKRPVTCRSHRTTSILDSSLLAAMTYWDHASLDLVFRDGAVYRYFAVPARIVEGLRTAPSPGVYFHRQIRNRFRYHRLT
jgi:KTSC domain